MAYYGTMYSGGSAAITSSCLDDVPFKLGPKFLPPRKVILPPELELTTPSKSTLVNAEYSFEVEEAVLKWSAERERQIEEQQRQAAERERQATLRRSQETDSSDSGNENTEPKQPIYENVSMDPNYENPGILRPKPAPRSNVQKPTINSVGNPTYTGVTIPNPLIANISSDILKPTPISSNTAAEQDLKRSESKEKKDFDMTWFEREDDPFDNLELQTINDMEELANVLEETKKTSPIVAGVNGQGTVEADLEPPDNGVDNDGAATSGEIDKDLPMYENIESTANSDNGAASAETEVAPVFDIRKLPPIPPRRDLVGSVSPLPPIGRKSVDSALDQVTGDQNFLSSSEMSNSLTITNVSVSSSFPQYENPKSISPKAPVPKPPRTFKYSRYNLEEEATSVNNSSNRNGLVQSGVNPPSDSSTNTNGEALKFTEELNFDNSHFGVSYHKREEIISTAKPVPVPRRIPSPPPRPSSQQSWNRYSPLPAPEPSSGEPTVSRSLEAYERLSNEARTSVDSLVTMGFGKDRVIRAVEKLGEDQKEVVEFLCLVDQLTEKGFEVGLVESALLLFQNNMKEASAYLELFKQFEELGFHGDRIKEVLVNTKNDREKSLDILTASS